MLCGLVSCSLSSLDYGKTTSEDTVGCGTKNCVQRCGDGNPVTHGVPGGDPQKTWTTHVSTPLSVFLRTKGVFTLGKLY